MDVDMFMTLSNQEVAALVQDAGQKIFVFPINGTRRWFMLERPPESMADFAQAYLDAMIESYIRLYGLFFDHGITTVLAPAFGPDLMARSDEYAQMAVDGWVQMIRHPDFVRFYTENEICIRFYGDYRKVFKTTPFAYLADLFDELTAKTIRYKKNRLFFGLFAQDATETVAALSVDYYKEHGKVPDKRTLVELYYGDYVAPVDVFIGFDKFAAFDMPLVATGSEDLYFTVAPSPYFSAEQLRVILYDHLYVRPEADTDYAETSAEEWGTMREFYHANRLSVMGIGKRNSPDSFWYLLPQVKLPEDFS